VVYKQERITKNILHFFTENWRYFQIKLHSVILFEQLVWKSRKNWHYFSTPEPYVILISSKINLLFLTAKTTSHFPTHTLILFKIRKLFFIHSLDPRRSLHAIGFVTNVCSPGQYRCDLSTNGPECAFIGAPWLCDRYWAMLAAAAAIENRGMAPRGKSPIRN
jgi:hypothetical protein